MEGTARIWPGLAEVWISSRRKLPVSCLHKDPAHYMPHTQAGGRTPQTRAFLDISSVQRLLTVLTSATGDRSRMHPLDRFTFILIT